MLQKRYFSYIRVSTQRQGQIGTSLQEQQSAIERYSERWSLNIVRQYEEQETAAKQGRPVFIEMLKALKSGKADGVIIHKIDRSARNLKDWADLGALIDTGLEVHFASESLDLNSRGGRLSADIQAVVAADYIRNLREEVLKGFYGRIKQGLYPMPAPVGYTDEGQGKAKEPHPVYAPLVKKAFELYASGCWSLASLRDEITGRGLRNRNGGDISKNGISTLLRNVFYLGLIRVEKTGEIFRGIHRPIISKKLFDRVQIVLDGKLTDKKKSHYFTFRKLIACSQCRYNLIAEKQKGYVYYRCQRTNCPQKTIREDAIERELLSLLKRLRFTDQENRYLKKLLAAKYKDAETIKESTKHLLEMKLEKCRERLARLTDALIDNVLEEELFVAKKNRLIVEEQKIHEKLQSLETGTTDAAVKKTREILELANRVCLSYKSANAEEKREMVKIFTSNLVAEKKTVLFKLNYPFELIVNQRSVSNGGPHRDVHRTLESLIDKLIRVFLENPIDNNTPSNYEDI